MKEKAVSERVCDHPLCNCSICSNELLALKIGDQRTNVKLTPERKNQIVEHLKKCRECWELVLVPMRKELGVEKPPAERHLVAVA